MFKGKTALVTGGSSGIGKAVSLQLAREGAHVEVVASSDMAKAEAVVAEIAAAGGSATPHVADVRRPDHVAQLVGNVEGLRGGIDMLVTAAGVFQPSPIGATDLETFDQMVDTNFRSAFLCVNAVAPGMAARGSGKIVCFSSVASVIGVKGFSAYCATKAAVSMMVRSLAIELAPQGININAVAPGNTATPMNAAVRTDPANIAFLEEMKKRTPSPQVFSDPEDIAGLVLFLLSHRARAMHGSTVLMDEGLSAGI
ncbi:SDR family oxidoreductase [Sphingopyxis sp.]|uniref:SDR family NAD(P)-dependent oxidoreductase n=1 Tax=Sphingopyxis sp. TaxID=1908224 RepID=UPI0025FC97C2|nr:SDR family oxidoreductase [Sphingopyxis sp.]